MPDIIERVTQKFEQDQQRAHLKVAVDEMPISYTALTNEWLTQALCRNQSGACVVAHRLGNVDDGNTNRIRIYLEYNAAGQAAALPPTVFCKASHHLEVRLFLATSGLIVGEDMFYREFHSLLDIEMPNCLYAAFDPVSYNSIFIFDDLARHGAIFCDHTFDVTKHRAQTQVELLAQLHGRFYDSPEITAAGLWTYEEMFDRLDNFLGLENYSNQGFIAATEVIPESMHDSHDSIWKTVIASNALHTEHPRTLTHNDVHLRNWYLSANDQMRLCDWQCIAAGHWARDLAYTISSSLLPENRRIWEKELIQHYIDTLHAAGGPQIPFSEAWTYYRQHLCSALIWWTSTLQIATAQPKDATLELIRRMAIAIDDLDALRSFD